MYASFAILLFSSWVTLCTAQVTHHDLPSCALDCFPEDLPSNSSSAACHIDAKSDFEQTFSPCFYAACPVYDVLAALNVTSIICDQPVRDISWAIRGFVIASTVIASGVISLRVLYKWKGLAGGIGWDDYTIVIGVVVTLIAAIGQFLTAWYGMGRDQWKVPADDVAKVYKCFFVAAIGYKLGNGATRVSLLCFYLRIFQNGKAHVAIGVCIVLTIVIGIAFALADSLQCTPARSFWEGWDGELWGQCRSLSTISWVHSVLNIVLDVATLALAFWIVRKLNMNWRKKIAVIGMFLLGSAITLVSFLRLQALPPLSNIRNRTWNLAPVAYWSAIEMFFGLVCACLPALKQLGDATCGSGRNTTVDTGYEERSGRSNSSQKRSKHSKYSVPDTATTATQWDGAGGPASRDGAVSDTEMATLGDEKDDALVIETYQASWDATKAVV